MVMMIMMVISGGARILEQVGPAAGPNVLDGRASNCLG